MLVLTRKKGQSIAIGVDGEISIEVVSIGGGQVKLGVTASKDIPVHRDEIFKRILSERAEMEKINITRLEEENAN